MPSKVYRKLKENRNINGTIYTISYFVHDTDIASFRKVYGNSADSWTGGSFTYIFDYDEDRDGQHYIVHYKAYSAGYEDNKGVTITSPRDVYRSYGVAEFNFEPRWWGVRKADEVDVSKKAQAIDMSSKGDSFVGDCHKGDWIYIDYSSDENREGSASSALNALCPFLKTSTTGVSLTEFPITLLLQDYNMVTYRVRYATNKRVNAFGEWEGVNPASNPFGLTKHNPYSTTKYLWKATTQSVEEDGYTDPDTGLVYNLVDRTCTKAIKTFGPGISSAGKQLIWNPEMNSGTWDWD